MSIHRSFSIGEAGEKRVISMFTAMGIKAEKNEDKATRADYDLICEYDGEKFTAEVKYDVMSEKTGNVAFEIFNSKSNKPSGVFGTKADLWIHILPDDTNMAICICSVKKIRKYSRDIAPFKILKSVGDANADILLYKVEDVLEHLFDRIDNIDNDKAIKLVLRNTK